MSKGIASLARQVASKGRGGDSTLLHIHPSELMGMRTLLKQIDPDIEITLNPETGMYEAFSWKKLLAAVGLGASVALMFTPFAGLGPAGAKASLAAMTGLAGKVISSAVVPALISGTAATAVSAFKPDEKKESQQALTALDKYKAAEKEKNDKSIIIPQMRPLNTAPTISQPTTAQPAPVSTSTTTAQPTGIASALTMGATPKSQSATVPQKGIASVVPDPVFQSSVASDPVLPPPIASEQDDEYVFPDGKVSRAAEGGSLEPEEKKARQIVQDAMEAIRGAGDDPEGSLNTYLAYYGKDALKDLYKRMSGKEEVEEEDNYEPPEGMIKGPGNGMDDMATARMAHGGQKVLLSNDEFIIPADVVSGLGDGSSESGARKLYAMMDRVRMDRTGNKKQPGKVKDVRVLPA